MLEKVRTGYGSKKGADVPDLDNRRSGRPGGSTDPQIVAAKRRPLWVQSFDVYTTARCTNPRSWRCFASRGPCSRATFDCLRAFIVLVTCSVPSSSSTRATRQLLGEALAQLVRPWSATCTLAPALGGIVIGHEVARALDVRSLFAERHEGTLTLRRGFTLSPDDRVLVVEDVVTTAGSTRETIAVAERAGAQVVGACAIVDRSGGTHGLELPFAALLPMQLPLYSESECPMCKQGIAIVKPGSRSR